jgi:hypothetical protein
MQVVTDIATFYMMIFALGRAEKADAEKECGQQHDRT